ncbi:hypothetical protein BD626DRAFT_497819 [Schizophyllum amplum]|uniref:Uncharacterized protein n=1 Tax=Schizophyllum amplum TaxID=97359 RepID=A0A550CCP1_9AGAR|nr:hypothetical protein BD626DRAFT_497819 [Auriculariopsis ampla]
MRRPWSPSSDPSVEAVDFSEYQRAIAGNQFNDSNNDYNNDTDRQQPRRHDDHDPRYEHRYDNDYDAVVSPIPRHAPAPFSPPLSPPAMTVASHSSADSYGGMTSFAAASNPSLPPGAPPRQPTYDPFAYPGALYRRDDLPEAEIDITNLGSQRLSHPPEVAYSADYHSARTYDADFAPPPHSPGSYGYHDPFSATSIGPPSYGHDSMGIYGPARSYGHGVDGSPVLPWGNNDADHATIADELKEERVRMLEERFATDPTSTSRSEPDDSGEYRDSTTGALIPGTVDRQGDLVTNGPKKRLAVRVLQLLLAIGAAIPGIWAAIFLHPKTAPSPKGSVASYVLYVWGAIGLVLVLSVYFIHPCTRRRKFAKAKGQSPGGLANTGMMVLPVMQPGGKKHKKGKKGKKGRGDVQVNLIVDPAMFGRGREDEDDEEEEEEPRRNRRGEPPGAWDGDSSSADFWKDEAWGTTAPPKKKRKPRRSIMASLAAEKHWRRARSYAHKLIWVDAGMLVVYFAVHGLRCNRACACVVALLFGVTILFGVKDLAASKISPRQRGV